jgi:hypothetical protein
MSLNLFSWNLVQSKKVTFAVNELFVRPKLYIPRNKTTQFTVDWCPD